MYIGIFAFQKFLSWVMCWLFIFFLKMLISSIFSKLLLAYFIFLWFKIPHRAYTGLSCCLSGKESSCQCRRHRFDLWVRTDVLVAQLCPTLCDPMDCSLPGSSVHGIFPGDLPDPGIKPRSPILQAAFYHLSHQGIPYRLFSSVQPPQELSSSFFVIL